jgi:Helix-turn-helix family
VVRRADKPETAGGGAAGEGAAGDWTAVARRNSRSVQTTIGWIFWDPGAVARYEALGLPGPLGYIAARAAPLAPAGSDAVTAAFGSISPAAIRLAFDMAGDFTPFWDARNEAVSEGLRQYAPDICTPLEQLGPALWDVVARLPAVGRVFFGAHLRMARPDDPLLSGWHAVNCVREWRGDTHWVLVAAAGLTGIEASILHNAWLGYERDWLPRSRGSADDEIAAAWEALEHRGLAINGAVSTDGIALRQRLEDDTDALTTSVWQLLGLEASEQFAADFEPPCERLLRRVDETAGPNYQPASRVRPG